MGLFQSLHRILIYFFYRRFRSYSIQQFQRKIFIGLRLLNMIAEKEIFAEYGKDYNNYVGLLSHRF